MKLNMVNVAFKALLNIVLRSGNFNVRIMEELRLFRKIDRIVIVSDTYLTLIIRQLSDRLSEKTSKMRLGTQFLI